MRHELIWPLSLLMTCCWNAVAMGGSRPQWRIAFPLVVLLLLVTVAVSTDLQRRKIPNWLTYGAFLCACGAGIAVSLARVFSLEDVALLRQATELTGLEPSQNGFAVIRAGEDLGIEECLIGAAACFFPMYLSYRTTGRGAGDVKLATAIGSLVGWICGLNMLITTYLVAGVCILVWAVWRLGTFGTIHHFFAGALRNKADARLPVDLEQHPFDRTIPMAPFFAIGTLITLMGVRL